MTETVYAGSMSPARQARIAGFCYLLVIAGGVFAALFVPSLLDALLPWILVAPFVGEVSLALWLAVKGVRATDPVVPSGSRAGGRGVARAAG